MVHAVAIDILLHTCASLSKLGQKATPRVRPVRPSGGPQLFSSNQVVPTIAKALMARGAGDV